MNGFFLGPLGNHERWGEANDRVNKAYTGCFETLVGDV